MADILNNTISGAMDIVEGGALQRYPEGHFIGGADDKVLDPGDFSIQAYD